ncbi:MAG: hypothetical protein HY917_00490 [Candidatus Diapherotrites archaeon]|nr:hypothetical protein [Candidatus Diapherotrites archaeon]
MALENLGMELLEEARAQAKEKRLSASRQSEDLLKRAGAEEKSLRESARLQAERMIEAERAERTSGFLLKAQRMVSEARHESIEEGMKGLFEAFVKAFVSSKSYPGFLDRMVQEGLTSVGADAVVYVNARDKKLLKVKASFKEKDLSGGVIVASRDGRVRMDGSLESVFLEQKEEARRLVAQSLFGGNEK